MKNQLECARVLPGAGGMSDSGQLALAWEVKG